MSKGGARARSGPPPDPNALRRERDAGEWTILPPDGRPGPVPEWPLRKQSDREVELWDALWRKPQALMWQRYGQDNEVALYVRRYAEAEEPDTPVNLSTLVRQMADSLGLTTPGLRANRWRIGQAEQQPSEQTSSRTATPARASSKSRLKVVRDDDSGD